MRGIRVKVHGCCFYCEDVGMRKHIKRELLQALQTLIEAVNEISKLQKSGKREELQTFLAECQKMAISIGTVIEQSEGEGCKAVKVLEAYCDSLYAVLIEETYAVKSVKENLEQAVWEMEKLQERKEVVFLPYKASMWDSLESVWMAACEDENCDSYVIPIPYFDKKPDGTLGEMHYEGELYPKYVPITDWNSYDLKNRRPDVVYIHNPYDKNNYVTSVHPQFYTAELRKYTDRLVYIPYFILNEILPDNLEAVAEMEHFCTVPGVIHADRVIVQSETMRQIYINVLTKHGGKNTRKIWEEKIKGMGSPKLDKVHNTTRKEAEHTLPQSWLDKIYIREADGTTNRRKVVLYNTSVQALLNHSESMINKLNCVFQVFRMHKDVVLLWRPHPLNVSTMESMKPKLLAEYQALVENYQKEGFGIYDDTTELHCAIAISDAYYGDGGSLFVLYQETGKPIMLQNYNIMEEI